MDFVYAFPLADVPGYLHFLFLGATDMLAAGRPSKKILFHALNKLTQNKWDSDKKPGIY